MPDSYDKFAPSNEEYAKWEVDTTVFKRLFNTEDGQYVLGKILEYCKFMDQCDNERDMALNNFAKVLIGRIFWDRDKKDINIHRIIRFVRKKLKRSE